MAADGYPKVTQRAWAELRSKAASAPSTKFTPSMVAAHMGMSNEKSALDNTVRPLTALGLLDENGGLTDLGKKWRVDATYSDACQSILDDVYPSELSALTTRDGVPDFQRVETWFRQRDFGTSNAKQMARTFVMIAEKTVPESSNEPSKNPAKTKNAAQQKQSNQTQTKRTPTARESKQQTKPTTKAQGATSGDVREQSGGSLATVNLNVDIPSDWTAEQIKDRLVEIKRAMGDAGLNG